MSRRTEVPWLPDRMLRAAIVAPWISAAMRSPWREVPDADA